MADRHRQRRVTLRAAPERIAIWSDVAEAAGVTLTEFAAVALDKFARELGAEAPAVTGVTLGRAVGRNTR